MSTRGLVGFVVNDAVKATYNHFDSYPNGLGLDVVKFVQGLKNVSEASEHAQAIILVSEEDEPTPEQVQRITGQSTPDAAVGGDWYAWLRDAQGDLAEYLRLGFMIDNKDFGRNSLFCEWGYLVNLDTKTVEVYRGFQKDPHSEGRWAGNGPENGYYGIRLIKTIPFTQLTEDAMSEIEREIYDSED